MILSPGIFIFKNSGEYYTSIDTIITKEEDFIIGYEFNQQNYKYLKWKTLVVQDKKEIWSVGSSRILQFRKEMFNASFYNAGLVVERISDFLHFFKSIPIEKYPNIVLINIDQFNLNQEVFENTESTVNMTRVVMSMNTSELGFEIKQIDGDLITVDFAGSSLNLPYCIQDYGSNFCIFLSRDTKSWAQSIANFLGDLLCAPSVTNDLIQALLYSDDDRFEDRYEQLCFEGKFNVTSHNDALEIVSFRSKILEQQDTNITNEPKIDRTPIIREPTKPVIREGEVKDKDSTKSKLKKEKISKNKSTKKLTVRKRNDAPSTKEIGDAGEEIVKIYLSKKGWKVQNRNEFYGMAVEGSDLIAEKDGKIRIIEVKSTNSNWDGNRSISWKQAVHALQYHDPENLHGRGHVTCWLYVVELVLGDEQPKIAEIDWCRAEPEFSFNPNEWAENFHHDEEE